MLYATNRFPGDGKTTQYEISFVGGYLDRTHVKAYVEGADLVQTPVTLSPGNFIGPYTIGSLAPVPVGATLVIYRDTPKAPIVDFVNGSRFTESNLDTATRQGSFIAAEGADAVSPAGLAGVIQQVTAFSAAAGVARDQAVAAQAGAVAAEVVANSSSITAQAASNAAAAAQANAAASASSSAGSAATSAGHATNSAASATTATGAANTATTLVGAVLEAQTQTNALLGVGIGTSYVDPEGDLIMTYNAATASITIDVDGILQLTY